MTNIHDSIAELVGNTPLVEFHRLEEALGLKAHIVGKLEYFNPAGSSKDRIALSMIEGAEKSGELGPGGTIVEFTSGNTGIGLAAIGAAKGYNVKISVQPGTSEERIKLIEAYGGQTFEVSLEGDVLDALDQVHKYAEDIPGAWIPEQFYNENNYLAHYRTTGPEIWRDTDGKVGVFVAGVGTGGTASGTAKYLKEKNPNVKVVAVEPHVDSISNPAEGKFVEEMAGIHKFDGVEERLVPGNVHRDDFDEIADIHTEEGLAALHLLARTEGIFVGPSSGGALYAAILEARKPENEGKIIVALFPDGGERYLSQNVQNIRPVETTVDFGAGEQEDTAKSAAQDAGQGADQDAAQRVA